MIGAELVHSSTQAFRMQTHRTEKGEFSVVMMMMVMVMVVVVVVDARTRRWHGTKEVVSKCQTNKTSIMYFASTSSTWV